MIVVFSVSVCDIVDESSAIVVETTRIFSVKVEFTVVLEIVGIVVEEGLIELIVVDVELGNMKVALQQGSIVAIVDVEVGWRVVGKVVKLEVVSFSLFVVDSGDSVPLAFGSWVDVGLFVVCDVLMETAVFEVLDWIVVVRLVLTGGEAVVEGVLVIVANLVEIGSESVVDGVVLVVVNVVVIKSESVVEGVMVVVVNLVVIGVEVVSEGAVVVVAFRFEDVEELFEEIVEFRVELGAVIFAGLLVPFE